MRPNLRLYESLPMTTYLPFTYLGFGKLRFSLPKNYGPLKSVPLFYQLDEHFHQNVLLNANINSNVYLSIMFTPFCSCLVSLDSK